MIWIDYILLAFIAMGMIRGLRNGFFIELAGLISLLFGVYLAIKFSYIANQVLAQIKDVPGIKDVGILRNVGQPEISVLLDEEKMAMQGVTKADAQAVIEMAIGGKTATQKYEGEKKFDIRIRYEKEYRKDEEDIMMLMIPTITGKRIPLKEIATVHQITGPAFIYRNDTKRFIGVKFSVRHNLGPKSVISR